MQGVCIGGGGPSSTTLWKNAKEGWSISLQIGEHVAHPGSYQMWLDVPQNMDSN